MRSEVITITVEAEKATEALEAIREIHEVNNCGPITETILWAIADEPETALVGIRQVKGVVSGQVAPKRFAL
jgi:hypothetical protein